MQNVKAVSDSGGGADKVIKYLENGQKLCMSPDGSVYVSGYYAEATAPSQWHGNLAEELGLSGLVETVDLEAMLTGETPGGETFARRQGGRSRRMGNDITISAPKSVSILALAVGDESVTAAHDRAVAKSLEYLEREVMSARYGRGGAHSEKTNSAAIAAYRHEDARPVDGMSDPDLHTHALAINVTTDGNGNYRASDLDFGHHAIRMHIGDYIYKAELAKEIESLGYQTRRTKNGFELADISDEQIASFSRRGKQVLADVEKNAAMTGVDNPSRAEVQKSVLYTRAAKGDLGRDELHAAWKTAAKQAGVDITPHESAAIADKDAISADSDPEDRAIDDALAHLDERDAVHNAESVYYHALAYGMGQVDPDRIRERLDERDDLHHTAAGIVSDATLIREDAVMTAIEKGQGAYRSILTTPGAERSISDTEERAGIQYSEDQRKAAVHALSSEDQITGIVGAAGSGKTTAIRSVADSARARGYEIVGLAPSAAAAEELTSAGADSTGTLAGHNIKGKPDSDAAPRWYVLDEAAMVSTRDMQAFVETLRPQDRVLLSGDPRQLQAVEAGAPYAQAIREGAISVAHMTEIRRQTDPQLREIAQAFAEGRAAAGANRAIRDYAETVAITKGSGAKGKPLAGERRAAIADRAADAYLEQSPDDRADTLVLAGNNDIRQTINERIRAGLVDEGRVDSGNEITVQTLQKSDMTSAQRRDVTSYEPGLVIRNREGVFDITGHDATANTVSLRNRENGDNRDVGVDSLADPRTRVYQSSERQVAPGDSLIATENDKDTGLHNGDRLTVDRINGDAGKIHATRQGDGKAIELDSSHAHALDYGWATTVHKAQGATAERAIVAGAASRVATAEQAYVACSRERSSLQIITDNPDALRKNWEKFVSKNTARDAVAEGVESQSSSAEADTTDWTEARAAAVARAAIEKAQTESQPQGEAVQRPEAEQGEGLQGGISTDDPGRDQPVGADHGTEQESSQQSGGDSGQGEQPFPLGDDVIPEPDAEDGIADAMAAQTADAEQGEMEHHPFFDKSKLDSQSSDPVPEDNVAEPQEADTQDERDDDPMRDPDYTQDEDDDIDPMDESQNPESPRYRGPQRDQDDGMSM